MRDPRAHFTEPARQRSAASDGHDAAVNRSNTYGPSFSLSGSRRSMDIPEQPALHSSTLNLDARGCVPTHRSVFRLFRRKVHQRSRSSSANGDASNQNTISSTSTGEHGGYLRSRKNTRGTTLSAQRTRSEFAIAGPPPEERQQESPRPAELRTKGSAARPMAQPRLHKADKGTIVQLRSSSSSLEKIAIPGTDGLHAAAAVPASDSAPASLASSESPGDPHSARAPPRKSASSTDMASLLRQLEAEVEQHAASDDELLTTADVAVHVLPDDSSDWNSDFSSPTSWRRPSDRPPSRITARAFVGSGLKDRAIDRGVLEAQHRILQQEKYLMQISNLSSSLAKLRPLILRCLVFELPDRGIQIGTTTFVSGIREVCGSIEPSVEEERLWELWRQAEALLTIMDNDNIPLSHVESRLTLSKKRAIMLAFCDWEQYSLYVQDAWDKARRGILQPRAERNSRRSSSNHSSISGRRASLDSRASSFLPLDTSGGGRIVSRLSLSRQRKSRRRSVVGVAPASLQRIADEAQAVQEECEQLLALMSPLYRESQMSPRTTFYAPETLAPAAATSVTAAAAATEAAAVEIDAMEKAPSIAATANSIPTKKQQQQQQQRQSAAGPFTPPRSTNNTPQRDTLRRTIRDEPTYIGEFDMVYEHPGEPHDDLDEINKLLDRDLVMKFGDNWSIIE
ncbi:hypothetical protein IWW36_002637 [Coemansia brasiliensis]|uniref:Uncharacterized protein n=1 Tax=Coemansia brasiliensis TaxID=2650707 RepID=A0A9W8LZP6_9FUNG|nr:hypothetical protein IWW36_002637 [Coemansia brasiliensis]